MKKSCAPATPSARGANVPKKNSPKRARTMWRSLAPADLFQLGIQLGAEQNHHQAEPDPHHEAHQRAERSIGAVVMREMRQIPREAQRHEHPYRACKHGAEQHATTAATFAIRPVAE